MNNLILVRHGQSEWNYSNRFTGWQDISLTNQGRLEAKQSGNLIKQLNINFEFAFTSLQSRANETLSIIINILKQKIKIKKTWQLNERHYGALTGLNKEEIKKKYGEKKVHEWRRSWDISPPPINENDPNNPSKNKIYKDLNLKNIPNCESLKDTYNRVIPYWNKEILPLLIKKKNIIISAHGNSLRGLYKKLFNISDINISNLEIPTGNPLFINFDKKLNIQKYIYLDTSRAKNIIND